MELEGIIIRKERREPPAESNPNSRSFVNNTFLDSVRAHISPAKVITIRLECIAERLSRSSKATFLSFTRIKVVPNTVTELIGPGSAC